RDGFIEKRTLDGKKRLWLVQLGTVERDEVLGVQVDRAGNVYVAGNTGGAIGERKLVGKQDVFVQKYSPDGKLVWSTQLGTTGDDALVALRLGPSEAPHLLTAHATGQKTFNRLSYTVVEEQFQALIALDKNTGSSRGGLMLGQVKNASVPSLNGRAMVLRRV